MGIIIITNSCTCDKNCDDPCPAHARENELQDELTKARNALRSISAVNSRYWAGVLTLVEKGEPDEKSDGEEAMQAMEEIDAVLRLEYTKRGKS